MNSINLHVMASFLDDYLSVMNFSDDICINGIQVEGKSSISKIISGVTASYDLFKEAVSFQANAILVHHGLFLSYKPLIIIGHIKKKLSILLKNNISLLTYHLPLDANQNLGNNIQLVNFLRLKVISRFGKYKNNKIGYIAYSNDEKDLSYFINKLEKLSEKENCSFIYYPFGKKKIKKIAIISGAGSSFIEEAVKNKCDLFITGEVRESIFHIAKEEGINYLSIGHYNSEKLGISSLGNLIQEKYNIIHKFIDIPNSI